MKDKIELLQQFLRDNKLELSSNQYGLLLRDREGEDVFYFLGRDDDEPIDTLPSDYNINTINY